VGAVIGGFLADLLGLGATNLLGSIILAFIGACLLIVVLRAVAGGVVDKSKQHTWLSFTVSTPG